MAGGAVTILQSLADHDPDIDAIYRLTQKLPLGFENSAKGAGGQAATKLGKVDVVPSDPKRTPGGSWCVCVFCVSLGFYKNLGFDRTQCHTYEE